MSVSKKTISLLLVFAVFLTAGYGIVSVRALDNADTRLAAAWESHAGSVDVSGLGITEENVDDIYTKAKERNPQCFWVGNEFSYVQSGDSVTAITKMKYIFDSSQTPTLKQKFDEAADAALSIIDAGMSDSDKLLALHDYLILHCEYDLAAMKTETVKDVPPEAYTAYGCLVAGTAVCQGYSYAYSYLLGKLGIYSSIVTSDAMGHAWNLVKVGENYYHVDVTYDDEVFNSPDGYVNLMSTASHRLFLLTDSEISDTSLGDYRHYDWDSDYPADKNAFDNPFLRRACNAICYYGGKFYFIEKGPETPQGDETAYIVERDAATGSETVLQTLYGEAWYKEIIDDTTYTEYVFHPYDVTLVAAPDGSGSLFYQSVSTIYRIDLLSRQIYKAAEVDITEKYIVSFGFINQTLYYDAMNVDRRYDLRVATDISLQDLYSGGELVTTTATPTVTTTPTDTTISTAVPTVVIPTVTTVPTTVPTTAAIRPSSPTLNQIINGSKSVSIVFKLTANTEFYRIYRKSAVEREYRLIDEIVSSVFGVYSDKTVVSGNKYTYTISAVNGGLESEYGIHTLTIDYIAIPTILSVKNTAAGVMLKWEGAADTDGYYVLRRPKNSDDTPVRVAVINGTKKTSYVDKKTVVGKSYEYFVLAYIGNRTGRYYTEVPTVTRISGVKISSVKNAKAGISVAWTVSKSDKGKFSYKISRKSGKEGWRVVKTVGKTSWVDTKTVSGVSYSYRVQAVRGNSDGDYLNIKSLLRLAAPKLASAKRVKAGVSLKWKKVSGAAGYYIKRKSSDGKYAKIHTARKGGTLKFTDKQAKRGVKYSYAVVAYKGKTQSAQSNARTIK